MQVRDSLFEGRRRKDVLNRPIVPDVSVFPLVRVRDGLYLRKVFGQKNCASRHISAQAQRTFVRVNGSPPVGDQACNPRTAVLRESVGLLLGLLVLLLLEPVVLLLQLSLLLLELLGRVRTKTCATFGDSNNGRTAKEPGDSGSRTAGGRDNEEHDGFGADEMQGAGETGMRAVASADDEGDELPTAKEGRRVFLWRALRFLRRGLSSSNGKWAFLPPKMHM